jgi:ubiquinone/menaquinone biosynthesis C-methylase UbiE
MVNRTATVRNMWNRRSKSWHNHVNDSPAFEQIRAAVVRSAVVGAQDIVVDLGAGTGFLALEIAPLVSEVIAVDVSEQMLADLEQGAHDQAQRNIRSIVADLGTLDLPPRSVDVVVSSYALHHLTDEDKAQLLRRARVWLRPGGRVVIADMMFGRTINRHDREIFLSKVSQLARKGPGGIWRIAKNMVRFGLRRGTERPVPPAFWVENAEAAGFVNVTYRSLGAEAGLLTASVEGTA